MYAIIWNPLANSATWCTSMDTSAHAIARPVMMIATWGVSYFWCRSSSEAGSRLSLDIANR